jgi:hypothetical protein
LPSLRLDPSQAERGGDEKKMNFPALFVPDGWILRRRLRQTGQEASPQAFCRAGQRRRQPGGRSGQNALNWAIIQAAGIFSVLSGFVCANR